MSDTDVFLWINGFAGKIAFLDEFFKGISNDYFPFITACLVLIWLWFGTRDSLLREKNQRAVIAAIISIGIVSGLVLLCNHFYFRERPFNTLPASSINIIFYKPTDSSFPSNVAAVIFAIAITIIIKNRKYGYWLLALAFLSSFGRVYMGVHYPLDILGGAALGALAAFISLGIVRYIKLLPDLVLKLLRMLSLA